MDIRTVSKEGWEHVTDVAGFGEAPIYLDTQVAEDYVQVMPNVLGRTITDIVGGLQVTPPWPHTICGTSNPLIASSVRHFPNRASVPTSLRYKVDMRNDSFIVVSLVVFKDGALRLPVGEAFVSLNKNGEVVGVLFDDPSGQELQPELLTQLQILTLEALVAFALCHTKGSTREEGTRTRAERRRHSRQKPLIRHHVLRIPQIEQHVRRIRSDNATGAHNAFHLCRGHFARYTEQNPLFGKFVGQVWRQAHFKGKDLKHLVTKSYRFQEKEKQAHG